MNILSKAPLIMGRFYLSIFNKKKLREMDERMKAKEHSDDDPVHRLKPLQK
jgi:hypothetical protein